MFAHEFQGEAHHGIARQIDSKATSAHPLASTGLPQPHGHAGMEERLDDLDGQAWLASRIVPSPPMWIAGLPRAASSTGAAQSATGQSNGEWESKAIAAGCGNTEKDFCQIDCQPSTK